MDSPHFPPGLRLTVLFFLYLTFLILLRIAEPFGPVSRTFRVETDGKIGDREVHMIGIVIRWHPTLYTFLLQCFPKYILRNPNETLLIPLTVCH